MGAVEGAVAASAEVLPRPRRGGDDDFDGCDGSIERADELVMGVLVLGAVPFWAQDVYLLKILRGFTCEDGRECGGFGGLAR